MAFSVVVLLRLVLEDDDLLALADVFNLAYYLSAGYRRSSGYEAIVPR